MNNYFSAALGIFAGFMCALLGVFNKENKWLFYSIICILALSFSVLVIFGVKDNSKSRKEAEEDSSLLMIACKNYYEGENYGQAYEALSRFERDDPKAMLLQGFFLTNGVGTDCDVEQGLEYYKKAMLAGEEKAESCLVVAAMKYYTDERKIDIIRRAYNNGNQTAKRYIDYLVSSIWYDNSNESLLLSDVWSLPESELLEILNHDNERWVTSTQEYNISMDTSSLPGFTRKYLYSNGTKRVYEESMMVKPATFPSWFAEEKEVW